MPNRNSVERDDLLNKIIDETTETLAYTIDAKDRYTRGHSFRVAKYSRNIARLAGKSEAQSREIYLAGLLHDIGKISISDNIINKLSELTDDEYEEMKKHTINGAKILEKMKSVPYLQNGALYHHERYDGKGYPQGLKGDEIPEMARIIAVADAYDTMTSNRSYRGAFDQGVAKQEIWKGMGTQFDPYYAKVMISLIDSDVNYDMREKSDVTDAELFSDIDLKPNWVSSVPKNMRDKKTSGDHHAECFCNYIKNVNEWLDPSDGVLVDEKEKVVEVLSVTDKMVPYLWCVPSVLLFSSDDGTPLGPGYDELGVFVSAGYSWKSGSAYKEKTQIKHKTSPLDWDQWITKNKEGMKYRFSLRREGKHVFIKLENEFLEFTAKVFLNDSFDKKVYFSLTGESCKIIESCIK